MNKKWVTYKSNIAIAYDDNGSHVVCFHLIENENKIYLNKK